ncbi:MAG: hypothetical protein QF824_00270 [Candidatus Woesearchaeota archaeon]|jgi:flavodoxin|nr:hypothetical protein [Candidatus Woesearchaeota archaeon]|tara:strand:+ start:538 stop:1011 length:474 start_codon:yes stop_codon:yes gene_type:complete
MKTLVVYYSRTGTTKKVGEEISKLLECDSEEISDIRGRKGFIGYIMAGKEASLKQLGRIEKTVKDASSYDLVVIGTPIWSFNMSSPIRRYLTQNKGKFKKVAFFCTHKGSGGEKAFSEMEEVSEVKSIGNLVLSTKEVVVDGFVEKVKVFVRNISSE